MVCALTPAGAHAQTAIYAEATAAKIPAANTGWMFGPTVGLYHDNGLGLVVQSVPATFAVLGFAVLVAVVGAAVAPRLLRR